MPDPDLGDIPEDYFAGGAHLATRPLSRILNAHALRTRTRHEPTITAARTVSSPGQGPQPVIVNALYLLAFTLNTDDAFRYFRIPTYYTGDAAIHFHWSKTADGNELGRAVRWRAEYVVFDGNGGSAAVAPSVVEVEDTYEDASADGTRIVHRTPDIPLTGFVAGWYASIRVTAITPTGAALVSEPGLFSMDLTYTERINR